MSQDHRFVADQMLGRLAKWLRMLGFDTIYLQPVLDSDLLAVAKKDNRILLTRDTLLMKVREITSGQVKSLLVGSDNHKEQLDQVLNAFHLKPRSGVAFCAEDDHLVEAVDKEMARQFVPRFVFQTQPEFFRCPACNRFYWKGTHWQSITKTLSLKSDV